MSKLDFNKPLDFAIATMSEVSTFVDLFNLFGRDQATWAIAEGTYKGGRKPGRPKPVPFLIFKSRSDYQAAVPQITDTGGRRIQKSVFPYRDGQTTDDLGAKGEDFDIEIMFYGPSYKLGMNRMIFEFNDPIPGTLEHPVRGSIRAKAIDWTLVHEHSAKNAVLLRVRFTAHDFEQTAIGVLTGFSTKSIKNALQNTIAMLQKIAAVIAAVRQLVGLISGAIEAIRQKIQEYYTALMAVVADAKNAFGFKDLSIGLFPITTINAGGGLAPKAGGRTAGGVNLAASDPNTFGANATTTVTAGNSGLSTASGGFVLVTNRFTTVIQPADPFANLPIDLLGDVAREAIEQTQIARRVEVLRSMVNEMAADIDAIMVQLGTVASGLRGKAAAAASTMIDAKLTLLASCDAMADTLRSGQSNGRPRIINYTAPHDMSIREAAFLNGLTPQDGADIATLNPDLESTNLISKGSTVLVPTFA